MLDTRKRSIIVLLIAVGALLGSPSDAQISDAELAAHCRATGNKHVECAMLSRLTEIRDLLKGIKDLISNLPSTSPKFPQQVVQIDFVHAPHLDTCGGTNEAACAASAKTLCERRGFLGYQFFEFSSGNPHRFKVLYCRGTVHTQ